MKAQHVWVSGRVQGVAFRWSTKREADRLGIRGWVRNSSDGRVEAHIQGEDSSVTELIDWMGKGPIGARVDRLESCDADCDDSSGFEIRRTVHG